MSVPQIQTRERYEMAEKVMGGIIDGFPSAETAIQSTVDALLSTLFVPAEHGCQASKERLEDGGFAYEPINWGDIGCSGVERLESGTYIVTVEEAAPECAVFAEWIGDWLRTWGWDVLVNTEW